MTSNIVSHTVVKNGMPFIGKVLEQVAFYMDKMFITVSARSNDGTLEEIAKISEKYPEKVWIDIENVEKPGDLAKIQQKQIDRTNSEWILFLSDDDYWPKDQLEFCLKELDKDSNILAYSVPPYQLIDWEHYDASWENKKSFSKFLRRKDLRYIKQWPRELPADKDNKPLYWRTHPLVKTLPYRYYHLSYLKNHTFRNEEWAKEFRQKIGNSIRLEKPLKI